MKHSKKRNNAASKPYALVTVRTASTRLPGKCFQPIVGDVSLIQVVIRRAKKVGCPIVLATTIDPSDDCLVQLARAENIDYFRGAVNNKIRRWADCFAAYDISEGILVDGDDPTFDYNVGSRALGLLEKGGSEIVMPPPEMTPGFFTYGLTRAGIERLLDVVGDPAINTDVITELIERAGLAKSYLPVNPYETEGHNVRLTIDYPVDLEFYRELYAKIDYLAPSPEVVRIALKYGLQKINWHMQEAFLKNQEVLKEALGGQLSKLIER